MSSPATPEEYWSIVDNNWANILAIFYKFLPMHKHEDIEGNFLSETLAVHIERLKSERSLDLPRYFNAAWAAAPDSSSIHSIPSWHVLCDLCSEEWCLHEN